MLDGLDGLIITGGRDVDPDRYGAGAARRRPTSRARDRDAWEFALLRGALARRLPVLGICRGAQVLNVALGGTLHQHLPDVFGHDRYQRRQRGVHHDPRCDGGRHPGGGADRRVRPTCRATTTRRSTSSATA